MEEGYSKEGVTKVESALPSKIVRRQVVRLVGRRWVQAVFQGGRKCVCGPMVVYLLKNGLPQLRFSVQARKVLGPAVERNRLKRLFREAIRAQVSAFVGYDVILIPRQAASGLPLSRLTQQLHRVAFQSK